MFKGGNAPNQVCLYISEMEVALQLCVLVLHLHASLAVWERITVFKGMTLNLSCPIKDQFNNHSVEWKNPDGAKDERYSLRKLSESEYNIAISNVTFSDGGVYTCSHYLPHTVDRTVEVTVLARPWIDVTSHEGLTVIKCTAEGTHSPPQIFWQFRNGPMFHSHPQVRQKDKKNVTSEMLFLEPQRKPFLVKCIVRHPALQTKLMDFVRIRPNRIRNLETKLSETTTEQSATQEPSTDPTTETEAPAPDFSTYFPRFSPKSKNVSEFKTRLPETTQSPPTTDKSPFYTTEQNGTTAFSPTLHFSTGINNLLETNISDTTTERPATEEPATDQVPTEETETPAPDLSTYFLPFSMNTEESTGFPMDTTQFNNSGLPSTNIPLNETKDLIENGNDTQKGNKANASLLVFLITCLMLGLLVVVIFIGIKQRRAYIAWKQEHEDTDTSESSSKSKSSQEDKNTNRRRGFFNTRHTQYVIQEPAVITSVSNPAAMTATEGPNEMPPTPQPPAHTVKETEL